MDCKISIDRTYTWEVFQGFFIKKFLDDFGATTSCFMTCYKIYIHWDNIRRYHFLAWEKIIWNVCIYRTETDILIGIALKDTIVLHGKNNLQHLCIPTRNWYIYGDVNVSHFALQEILLCTGKSSLLPWDFFINYCTVINIFSTQLWFHHTYTNTHITEGSIFISELLSLKPV